MLNFLHKILPYRVVDYITNGVRYVFRGDHGVGIVNTFSQDLEPESVTISNDDRFAFVSCQVYRPYHLFFLSNIFLKNQFI